jgi:hypothetical protein
MQVFDALSSYFFSYNSPLYWREVLEIIFFTSLFYYAAVWLKKDRQKNLLLAFYSYCALAFGSHYLGLTTISYTMFLFAPAVTMVFIVLHQEFLQKNFITLKNITPAKLLDHDWLETLIRTFLIRVGNHQEITCIIEQRDSLYDLVHTPLPVNARLEQELLDLLLTSPSFDADHIVWVNTQGQLIGINARWTRRGEQADLDAKIQELPAWKQNAIFFTAKTDAIVLHINATSRTFDVIVNGMVIDRMHAAKALELIKKYIVSRNTNAQWGGVKRETLAQKSVPEQRSN